MIDIHTHILPELDDGSESVDESIKMLDMLSNQGVDTVVATPHFYIDRTNPEEFLTKRAESFEKLKAKLDDFPKRPQIALGAEVQFYPEITSLENIELFCIGQTKYILIEMPFFPWNRYVYQVLSELSMSRLIVPVIAHIERYLGFMNEKETLFKLKEAGALIQINSSFLYNRSTKRQAINLIKKDEISFLGSDCHNTINRIPDLADGINVIQKKLGESGFKLINYREQKLKKNLIVY